MSDFNSYSPEFEMNGARVRIAESSMGGVYFQTLTKDFLSDGTPIEHWRFQPIQEGPGLDAIRGHLTALAEAKQANDALVAESAALAAELESLSR